MSKRSVQVGKQNDENLDLGTEDLSRSIKICSARDEKEGKKLLGKLTTTW